MGRRAVIEGIGHAVPSKILTNAELEQWVDTTDEWITQRTGIRERRVCDDGDTCSSLSITASYEALKVAELDPADLDLVICATVTGDYHFPATACLIQNAIGAKKAGAMDLGAGCAGFVYAAATATGFIESGQADNVLVVGVDVLSKITNWSDRSTCVLFGDGAGAVVMKSEENTDRGVMKTVLNADGSGGHFIILEAGGSLHPMPDPKSADFNATIQMEGSAIYRFAVNAMGDACCNVLAQAGLDASQIDVFIPHQANLRIINAAAERLGLPEEKVFKNVHKYGNTGAGSIPLALYEAEAAGLLQRGMTVMTVGFGAGLVWGANVIRW